jgi:hypothetical protein
MPRTSSPGRGGDNPLEVLGGTIVRHESISFVAVALLSAAVASPLGVAPLAASAAGAAVDLTSCLAPGASTGDQRVFRTSQGSDLTETVLDANGWRGRDGWTATVEAQLASHAPTVRKTFVKPGRELLLGDLEVGDLTIDVGAPSKWYPLEAVPGRTYTTKLKGKALRDGQKVGSAQVSSAWQVVGFEPLTTEVRSYSDTVHIAAARTIEVNQRKGGADSKQESDVELWCVDGVGIVAANYAFRFYEDGKLVGQVDDFDSWLVSATVDGVAVN